MEIPPTNYPASRAALVAQNYINYQQGTPHRVFEVQKVKQASMEVSLAGGGGQRRLQNCAPSTHPRSQPLGADTPCHSLPTFCFRIHCWYLVLTY